MSVFALMPATAQQSLTELIQRVVTTVNVPPTVAEFAAPTLRDRAVVSL